MPGTVKSGLLPDADRSHKCDRQEEVCRWQNLPLDNDHFITEELFSQLYKPRFPKATELYADVCAYYLKYMKTTLPDAICDRKDALNKNEDNFFQYLLGRDDTPFTIERSASDYNNQMKYMDFLFYMTEDEALDKVLNVIKFKNSDESVYPSRQYDRLIKLRKEKLAEYLRVDENQLASTIHATMDIIKTESGAALRKGIGGLVEQIAFCGAQRTPMRFRADAMRSITDAPKHKILLFSFSAGSLRCSALLPV